MTTDDLVERLAQHRAVGAAPRDELLWLAEHGRLRELETGDVLTARGAPVEGLFLLLSGWMSMSVDRGAGLHKIMEWRGGDILGILPYSRLVSPPGDSVAMERSVVLVVHRDHFRDLVRECYEVASILVHSMLDRARVFTSSGLHDEKMISLGKLSAGLAHELNNPVSAIERDSALIADCLDDFGEACQSLGAAMLNDSQQALIRSFRKGCLAPRVEGVRSPIQEAQREEALEDWLTDHGLEPNLAETLVETSVTTDALDMLAEAIQGTALTAAVRWAAAGCLVRGIASEMQDAASRISGLVTAIKGFTHMDQAVVAEPVDLAFGLSNTIAVVRSKAKHKSATIMLDVAPDFPRVRGFAGELNQIWSNLIDNALDAIGEGGRVEVSARCERDRAVVRIVDNGPGIPATVRERIFDPFFTTKAVGLGTGLGLDIVRRLVRHNDSEIVVESEPGRTEFRVLLPLATSDGAGSSA